MAMALSVSRPLPALAPCAAATGDGGALTNSSSRLALSRPLPRGPGLARGRAGRGRSWGSAGVRAVAGEGTAASEGPEEGGQEEERGGTGQDLGFSSTHPLAPLSLFPWSPSGAGSSSLVPLPAPGESSLVLSAAQWVLQPPAPNTGPEDEAHDSPGPMLPPEDCAPAPAPAPMLPMSQVEAQGIILRAAMGTGWTTETGLEGPSLDPLYPSPARSQGGFPGSEAGGLLPFEGGGVEPSSSAPHSWPELSRSPRRTARVKFTCNVCGARTMRAINPHAYEEGTIFVQCGGCLVFHKLVDNLNLFHELRGYVFQGADAGRKAKGFGLHESVDILGVEDQPLLPPFPF